MSTTEGEEPEEKKYCCGNSAQNEAGYVSKCDIVSCFFREILNNIHAYYSFIRDMQIVFGFMYFFSRTTQLVIFHTLLMNYNNLTYLQQVIAVYGVIIYILLTGKSNNA